MLPLSGRDGYGRFAAAVKAARLHIGYVRLILHGEHHETYGPI